MQFLISLVHQLEAEPRRASQLLLLQSISDALLTSYRLSLPSGPLYPLWVEAYYYHPGRFEDQNTHRAPMQRGRFGKLYFHRKGWGGVDLCLSLGDYGLSFLLKYTRTQSEFFSQIPLYRFLNAQRKAGVDLESAPVLERLPEGQEDPGPIFHSPRKGLCREDEFSGALLASLKGVKKYKYSYVPGFGKEKLARQYMQEHALPSQPEVWDSLIGWVPRRKD